MQQAWPRDGQGIKTTGRDGAQAASPAFSWLLPAVGVGWRILQGMGAASSTGGHSGDRAIPVRGCTLRGRRPH